MECMAIGSLIKSLYVLYLSISPESQLSSRAAQRGSLPPNPPDPCGWLRKLWIEIEIKRTTEGWTCYLHVRYGDLAIVVSEDMHLLRPVSIEVSFVFLFLLEPAAVSPSLAPSPWLPRLECELRDVGSPFDLHCSRPARLAVSG